MYFLCQNRRTGELIIAYGKDGADVAHNLYTYMQDNYLIGGALKKSVVKNLNYPIYFEEE